jgi:hypothetical protein
MKFLIELFFSPFVGLYISPCCHLFCVNKNLQEVQSTPSIINYIEFLDHLTTTTAARASHRRAATLPELPYPHHPFLCRDPCTILLIFVPPNRKKNTNSKLCRSTTLQCMENKFRFFVASEISKIRNFMDKLIILKYFLQKNHMGWRSPWICSIYSLRSVDF